MQTAIICTTIFDLEFLFCLVGNLDRYGHKDDTQIIVIPDRKSPPSSWERARTLQIQGYRISYPTLEDQERYLSKFPSMADLVPYDSDNRRNVGFLMALESGAELLISMDDDNFPDPAHDFVGCHAAAGKVMDVEHVESSSAWFNICDLLSIEPASPVFPRGFPYRVRRSGRPAYRSEVRRARIGVNLGLWTGDPDVDAISRNYAAFRAISWTGKQVALGPGTWSPINTQNTGLIRELVPAYYYVLMGERINGLVIDRFGDILSGYFVKKVCDHLGYSVLVGAPICNHERATHDLFRDLYHELAGIALLEEFTLWLESVRLQGDGALEAYRSLAEQMDSGVDRFQSSLWSSESRSYFHRIAHAMRMWSDATEILL